MDTDKSQGYPHNLHLQPSYGDICVYLRSSAVQTLNSEFIIVLNQDDYSSVAR